MTTSNSRIVIGIDEDNSADALAWAAVAAERHNLPLHLVCAFQMPSSYADAAWAPLVADDPAQSDYRAHATKVLEQALVAVGPGIRVTTETSLGYPAQVLIEASEDATMVVVGSRRRGSALSMLLGSVGNAVASRAACPAVIIRGPVDPRDAAAPVLVGVDGGPLSRAALRFGFDQASQSGAPLMAVMCWWPSGSHSRSADLSDPWQQEYRGDTERRLAECLAGWQEKYPDVQISRDVLLAAPAASLIELGAQAQLVVVGAHSQSKGPRTAALLGSVSQAVLHHLNRPVAVVHS